MLLKLLEKAHLRQCIQSGLRTSLLTHNKSISVKFQLLTI